MIENVFRRGDWRWYPILGFFLLLNMVMAVVRLQEATPFTVGLGLIHVAVCVKLGLDINDVMLSRDQQAALRRKR